MCKNGCVGDLLLVSKGFIELNITHLVNQFQIIVNTCDPFPQHQRAGCNTHYPRMWKLQQKILPQIYIVHDILQLFSFDALFWSADVILQDLLEECGPLVEDAEWDQVALVLNRIQKTPNNIRQNLEGAVAYMDTRTKRETGLHLAQETMEHLEQVRSSQKYCACLWNGLKNVHIGWAISHFDSVLWVLETNQIIEFLCISLNMQRHLHACENQHLIVLLYNYLDRLEKCLKKLA